VGTSAAAVVLLMPWFLAEMPKSECENAAALEAMSMKKRWRSIVAILFGLGFVKLDDTRMLHTT
jgi:hypothetical protein